MITYDMLAEDVPENMQYIGVLVFAPDVTAPVFIWSPDGQAQAVSDTLAITNLLHSRSLSVTGLVRDMLEADKENLAILSRHGIAAYDNGYATDGFALLCHLAAVIGDQAVGLNGYLVRGHGIKFTLVSLGRVTDLCAFTMAVHPEIILP